ncbi:hypothetical protein [Rhizobium sp. BR 314]|uniref:hypothetical protein n=1 Tax=Rhizobium sp. BR 314 TaxID=3040013 RepID=UPI0039BFE2D1
MPTLFRFLVICAVIGGSIYGAMWALALFVSPQPREITIRIPSERINPPATANPATGNPPVTGALKQ